MDFAGADFVVDVSAFLERRIAALRAHRSQHLSIDRCFFSRPGLDRSLATEIWRQGYGPPLRHRPATERPGEPPLLFEPGVMVTSVPWQLRSSQDKDLERLDRDLSPAGQQPAPDIRGLEHSPRLIKNH